MRALAVLPFVALGVAVLPGCGVERICQPGEVVVERAGGGRTCEQPDEDDPDCPDGQVLLKAPDVNREGCIEDEYSEDPYTDRLPAPT
jgi:hypothetical protein